jgi:hypothetical protein
MIISYEDFIKEFSDLLVISCFPGHVFKIIFGLNLQKLVRPEIKKLS